MIARVIRKNPAENIWNEKTSDQIHVLSIQINVHQHLSIHWFNKGGDQN
jgi:hypothetical protein